MIVLFGFTEKSVYFIHIEYDYLLPREVERHILEVEQDDNKANCARLLEVQKAKLYHIIVSPFNP